MLHAFKQKWVYKKVTPGPSAIKRLFLQAPLNHADAAPIAPLHDAFSARSGPSSAQKFLAVLAVTMGVYLLCFHASGFLTGLYWLGWGSFMLNAVIRLAACVIRPKAIRPLSAAEASNENLPTYSVIVALYKETEIVPQILQAMLSLNYPNDRLEILFALEADDFETIDAFHAQVLPSHVRLIEVPEGFPRTKPRALNYALERALGDLVVIYDAEDQPHPDQLREAAHRFSTGDPRLACLQAPLRPHSPEADAGRFIARQFTAEYAVQFDVILPAMHAIGLPFPLGGTSNHFKAEALKAIGAWDAYNVTEDADLGLRLAQYGYRSGMIHAPTVETPPAMSLAWVPQRTRWIKGYMQTLLVHTRLQTAFKPKVWLGMVFGVGMSVTTAVCYAPLTILLMMSLLLMMLQRIGAHHAAPLAVPWRDLGLFAFGTSASMTTLVLGAKRAKLRFGLKDMLSAPVYWSLQSTGASFALYQLITKPFHWDKTDHAPLSVVPEPHKPLYEAGSSAYAKKHDHFRHSDHLAHKGVG